MNLKKEMDARNITYREFVERIKYTEQGLANAVGTAENPKEASEILKMAFVMFLLEKSGFDALKFLNLKD